MNSNATRLRSDAGVAAVALVFVLVPLLCIVGAYMHTMTGRNQRLLLEVREERAMLAAEAGIDYTLHQSRAGLLVAGPGATYAYGGTLPDGSKFKVDCVYLGGDGVTNDDDMLADEPDEDVFRVITTGYTQNSVRRVAAYLGFASDLPSLAGAVTVTNPNVQINIGGSGRISGFNHNLNNTIAAAGHTYGLAMAPPGTVAHLNSELTGGERGNVTGFGGTPSINSGPAINVQMIVDEARNGADVVITASTISGGTFGSVTAPKLLYREGDLRIQGNTKGYGLLVVNGEIRIQGTFNWYGVIVCTGKFETGAGNALVEGG